MQTKERIKNTIIPLTEWYKQNKKPLPWRMEKSPYRVWISEIMLQQTRTGAVIPYFLRFIERYPTVFDLAEASDDELMKLWEGLGYYSRARNLKKCARVLVDEYGGTFPEDKKILMSLPGIGPYTAGAISSIAYGKPTPAIDGNVLRVMMRLLASDEDIADEKTKRSLDELLSSVYPEGALSSSYTEAIMELGENICIPNGEPRCDLCPIAHLCRAHEGHIETFFPQKSPKKPRRIEPRTLLIFAFGDTFYIRKRAPKGLLASLYEFMGLDGHLTEAQVRDYLSEQFISCQDITRLDDGKHIFTHIEWWMQGYLIRLATPLADAQIVMHSLIPATLADMKEKYSIPTAFKMFLRQLEGKM